MFQVPEKYRFQQLGHYLSSDMSYGNNGVFIVPFESFVMQVIVSDGEGWDHVSVSLKNRTPNWREMCFIKEMFWGKDACVVQYHPPESEYINNHPFCLHLWKSQTQEMPLPPWILVGVK